MTRIGDVTIPTTMAHETWAYSGLNVTLGPNAAGIFDIGSYVMPMTGRLTASLLVQCQWSTGIQQVSGVLSDSIPAPADGFGGDMSLDGISRLVVGTMNVMSIWPVMAAGTSVTLKLRVNTSFFATNVTVNWCYGWLRSYRTDS